MITGMSVSTINREELNQTGKISFSPVTERVRPKLDISRIHGRINHIFWAFLLSKNAILNKNPLIIVPVIRRNHFLPIG